MAYTKNHDPWTASDSAPTTTDLNNFETQYTEASSYLSSHGHTSLYYTKSEMNSTFWSGNNDGSGSGADADLIYKNGGNLHAASFAGLGIPTGLIIMWSGGAAPTSWHLCDGAAGTVNLLDRFIVGAGTGSAYSVGNNGGSTTFTAAGVVTVASHSISVAEMGSHVHPFDDSTPINNPLHVAGAGSGGGTAGGYTDGTTAAAGSGTAHGHSGAEGTAFTGNAVASMPYYYALAFIQKV